MKCDTSDAEAISNLLARVGVAEVYSPPRLTAMAATFGLTPGIAVDLTTPRNEHENWDLEKKDHVEDAERKIEKEDPFFLMGSPPCGPTSGIVRWLLWHRLTPQQRQELFRKGEHHCQVCCKLYWSQLARGRHFGHEHPDRNASWDFKCIKVLSADKRVHTARGPMCAHDLVGYDKDGNQGLVFKMHKFLTSAVCVAWRLNTECSNKDGSRPWHRHVPLMDKLPKSNSKSTHAARVYTPHFVLFSKAS